MVSNAWTGYSSAAGLERGACMTTPVLYSAFQGLTPPVTLTVQHTTRRGIGVATLGGTEAGTEPQPRNAAAALQQGLLCFAVCRRVAARLTRLRGCTRVQVEQCRELLNALAARFPDNSVVCMLNAAVLVREKRVAKADEVLGAFLSSRKTSAPPAARVLLMRAQLSAAAGDWQRTLVSLCELEEPLRYTPRLVATCVALHEQLGAPERAEELVDAALAFWDSCARSGGDSAAAARAACFARAAAELKQRHGRPAEAVVLYERLLHGAKSEESRAKALAGLVLACAHTDLVAAERYAAQLVPSGAAPELDAEELEAGIAFTKHADPVAPDVAAGAKRDAGAEAPQRAERRKRKRKPLYPKGFDPTAPGNPPPDPERWLPRRERSTFKGKRRTKAQQLRGAQGATPGAVAAAAQPAPAAPAAESKSKGKKGRR